MIHALTMPAWGMEDAPGTVVGWLVSEGDQIKRGQELVEIETTKLTNVVESPFEGRLTRVVLQKGDNAPTGSLLAVVVEGDASPQEVDAFVADHQRADHTVVQPDPTERLIETPAGRVRVMTQSGGPATPLLLLHGFGADWTSWAFLFRGLAQNRMVHMLDLPGHGSSFKDLGASPLQTVVEAVLETVRTVANGPVHVAGHSLGGLVAMKAAAVAPARFRSICLLAPAGLSPMINETFLTAFADADSRRNARAAIEMLVSDRDSVSLAMINDVIRARRVEGVKEALHSLRRALANDGRQAIDARLDLASLVQPVQLITAEQDRIITLESMPAGLANSRSIAGAGHLLHMEKAGEVQQLLETFMERNDG